MKVNQGGIVLAVCGAVASSACADLVYEINQEFSGATAPNGPPHWMTATFAQTGANEVTLTMDLSRLNDGVRNNPNAFVTGWYFNVTSPQEDNLGAITIAYGSGQAATSVGKTKNQFQADGDGKYDILFSFDTAQGAGRFTPGELSKYKFSAAGITPDWFYALSFPAGGKGPFYTALHVQGLGSGGGQSGWLTGPGTVTVIPLPTSAGLSLAGLLLVGTYRRR